MTENKYNSNKCSCGEELEYHKASDVSFGNFCTDVGALVCSNCGVVQIFQE